MRDILHKAFAFKAEDLQENGMFRGFASTFGNVDFGMDVVDKGAFKKSIKESRGFWPVLADHDPSKQIGLNLRAEETSEGLFVEGKLDLNVQEARERHSLAKLHLQNNVKYGLSIGYSTIKWEQDRENPNVRRLKELKLWEYSFVTFPMNPEAAVTAAKSQVEKANIWLQNAKEYGLTKEQLKHALLEEFESGEEESQTLVASLKLLNTELKAAPTTDEDPQKLLQSIREISQLLKKAN